jgi:hypothetical protein
VGPELSDHRQGIYIKRIRSIMFKWSSEKGLDEPDLNARTPSLLSPRHIILRLLFARRLMLRRPPPLDLASVGIFRDGTRGEDQLVETKFEVGLVILAVSSDLLLGSINELEEPGKRFNQPHTTVKRKELGWKGKVQHTFSVTKEKRSWCSRLAVASSSASVSKSFSDHSLSFPFFLSFDSLDNVEGLGFLRGIRYSSKGRGGKGMRAAWVVGDCTHRGRGESLAGAPGLILKEKGTYEMEGKSFASDRNGPSPSFLVTSL